MEVKEKLLQAIGRKGTSIDVERDRRLFKAAYDRIVELEKSLQDSLKEKNLPQN